MEKKNAHHSSVVVPEIMMEQLVSGGPDTVQAHPKIPVTATSNEKERERDTEQGLETWSFGLHSLKNIVISTPRFKSNDGE